MAANFGLEPGVAGVVFEFPENGVPKRHYSLKAEPGSYRLRGSPANLLVKDERWNIIELPVGASVVQQWMRARALHSKVSEAMTYLPGSPGWFELYKAFEALDASRLASGAISQGERERFKRTANIERHQRKFDPPRNPMKLPEARALLTTWLTAAVDEVLRF
jgi:hypothetical protein